MYDLGRNSPNTKDGASRDDGDITGSSSSGIVSLTIDAYHTHNRDCDKTISTASDTNVIPPTDYKETDIAVGYLILFTYIAKVRLFLSMALVLSVGYLRIPEDANRNMPTHRPSASYTKSGLRTTLLTSRVCSMVLVQNIHR